MDKFLIVEYYKRPFQLFHEELRRNNTVGNSPHKIRQHFWCLLPKSSYRSEEGTEIVTSYVRTIEEELSTTISRHSLKYWLHCYRRLSPHPIGEDTRPRTISLTRATLEIAIQKYSILGECDGVAISDKIEVGEILCGILLSEQFALERELVQNGPPQLVLTKFTVENLRELYMMEKLAYEIWKASAVLRGLGKGTWLNVDSTTGEFHCETTSMHWRGIEILDERSNKAGNSNSSATATIFGEETQDSRGISTCLLPQVNTHHEAGEVIQAIFKHAGMEVRSDWSPNFMWFPFEIKSYYEAHEEFAIGFNQRYGVQLQTVIAVIASLAIIEVSRWHSKKMPMLYAFERAYDGPRSIAGIHEDVRNMVSILTDAWSWREISDDELKKGLGFWTLNTEKRHDLDLLVPGPHSIILPSGENGAFVDFAWAVQRLHFLFVGVKVPNQNFKVAAFEDSARKKTQVIPARELKARNGTRKQIDVAFACGPRLIIAECKSVGYSIGVMRGNQRSVKHRQEEVVEKALSQVDEKAEWLAHNPKGLNYDVSRYKSIVPIGLSPFVEYVPYEKAEWWLTDEVPRVLTVSEMLRYADSGFFESVPAEKCINVQR